MGDRMKRKYDSMNQSKPRPTQYIGDPKLVPRIQKYLEANRSLPVISVSAMTDHLQKMYSDYGRKKKAALQKSVEKAYQLICRKKNLDTTAELEDKHLSKRRKQLDRSQSKEISESDDSFSEENLEYTQYQDSNSVNSLMSNLYRKSPTAKRVMGDGRYSVPSSPQQWTEESDTKSKNTGSKSDSEAKMDSKTPQRSKIPWHEATQKTKSDHDSESETEIIFISSNTSQKKQNENVIYGEDGATALGVIDSHTAKTNSVTKESSAQDLVSAADTSLIEEGKTNESTLISDSSFLNSDNLKSLQTPSKPEVEEDIDTKGKKSAKKVKKKTTPEEEKTKKKKGPEIQKSTVKFADVGGNDKTLMEICKLLVHMKHPEVYIQIGVTPPRGFLLHGPPGCGKTLLANAIAGELDLPFIKIAATEIVSGVSGESEEKVRDLFEKATMSAPCILFIDEIDAITPKRETASKDMERRIVAQLLTCMDDLGNRPDAHVLVIGATNRPDSLDPALRRAGRFDREISLGIPDENSRRRILEVLCRNLRLTTDFDFAHLAKNTPGFVGADLTALAREAAMNAVNRVFNDLQQQSKGLDSYTDPSQANSGLNLEVETSVEDKSNTKTSEKVEEENMENMKTQIQADNLSESQTNEKIERQLDEHCETNADGKNENDYQTDINAGSPVDTSAENQSGNQASDSSEIHVNGSEKPADVHAPTTKEVTVEESSSDNKELNSVLSWLKDQPPLTNEQLQGLCISMDDFKDALKHVQPSAKREGFATIPDVTWDDIGALHNVREELQLAILAPVRHQAQFKALGLTTPPGILLAGPPGCGKTLLAKAIANESGINFISVKGPELLNMYVGESERAVRQVFQRARNSNPCVIFFDELDALCPKRSDAKEGGASVRVVNQLLTEMDGLEERKQVFIMGATNRPDIIDPAILRPGRLDKILYVGLPTESDREDILKTITKNGTKPLLAEDVSLYEIARDSKCYGYTGADLAALVREAAVLALKEILMSIQESSEPVKVYNKHFTEALNKVKPSVSEKDHLIYEKMKISVTRR